MELELSPLKHQVDPLIRNQEAKARLSEKVEEISGFHLGFDVFSSAN